jgi:TolB protein
LKKSELNKIIIISLVFVSLIFISCQEDVRVLRGEDTWLVYISDKNGNHDVFAINPINKEKVLLYDSEFNERDLRYNPYDNKIIFKRYEENKVMMVENKDDLFLSPSNNSIPSWSSKGKIVYTIEENGTSNIYIADNDGGNVKILTNSTERIKAPAYDRNGEKIVYAKQVKDGWDLFVMDIANDNEMRITNLNVEIDNPSWSPDGKRIALEILYDGQSEIAYVDVSSLKVSRLTNRSGDDINPSWAPDSFTIAFESDAENSNYDIWIIDIETRELTKFTEHPGYDGNPIFVPYSAIMDLVNK